MNNMYDNLQTDLIILFMIIWLNNNVSNRYQYYNIIQTQ